MGPLTAEDPRAVGEYRLHARLGAGGMGRVFLGSSLAGRAVAVKIVHPELARDEAFVRRFGHEVAAARAVSGAYTAPVVAAGLDDNPPWLATVFVPGPSLADALAAGGSWPEPAVWKLAAGLVEALRAIHAANLVHRDLKPHNVLLAMDGPRVIDFGISRALGSPAMTAAGTVMGSPSFMSPEQAEGAPMSPASDVFSLGCVLAFAATGTSPFGNGDPAAMLYRVVHAPPVLDGVPKRIREFVAACLAKRPADRPPLERLAYAIAAELEPHVGSPANYWPPAVASVIYAYQVRLEPHGMGSGAVDLGARAARSSRTGRHAAPARPQLAGIGAGGRPSTRRGLRVSEVPELSRRQILTGLAGACIVGLATIGWELSRGSAPRRARGQHQAARMAARPAGGKAANPGSLIWSFGTGGVAADLAFTGGVLYAGSTDGSVYALHANGSKTWSVPTSGPVYSAPAVADGFVFVGSDDNNVYALRTSNGAELWNYPTGAAVRSGPTVAHGKVYVGSNDHNLYALRVGDGEGLWAFRTHGPVVARPAVALGMILLASEDDNLYALRENNGKEIYGGATGGPVSRGPVVVDGVAYLGSDDHHVYAIHATSGEELWSHPTQGPVNSAPAVAGGVVYVGSDDHHVYALGAANGAELWSQRTGGVVRSGPVVAEGTVYAGSSDSHLYALRASDGAVLWEFPAGGPVTSSPVIADGVVYVGSEDGGVHAVQA
jgi:outer membrane protein assembly factor BamB